jgi:hypothetical protein
MVSPIVAVCTRADRVAGQRRCDGRRLQVRELEDLDDTHAGSAVLAGDDGGVLAGSEVVKESGFDIIGGR